MAGGSSQRLSTGAGRKARPSRVPATEIERCHFEQACEMIRHHSSLRFKQLTVFVAINGGLFIGLFRLGESLTSFQLMAFAALGIIAGLAFSILEVRLNFYLDHYRAVALDYEQRFGLSQHLFSPDLRGLFFRGRVAVMLFIAGTVSAWLVALSIILGDGAAATI